MDRNQKIILLLGLIFATAILTGTVSAAFTTVNSESSLQALIGHTPIHQTEIYHNSVQNQSLYSEYLSEEIIAENAPYPENLASEPTDQQLKDQQRGIKNLQTISAGGIPPKGFDEMVSDTIDRLQSMNDTFKSKIAKSKIAFFYRSIHNKIFK